MSVRLRSILICLAFSVALLVWAGCAPAVAFRVQPYLQNPAPDAVTVVWFSNRGRPGVLSVDGVGKYRTRPQQADALAGHLDELELLPEGAPLQPPFMHRVRVTGLRAGLRYAYAVAQSGAVYRSHLRATPPADAAVRFIVYADSETEPESSGSTRRWSEPGGNWDRQYVVDQTVGYHENLEVMASRAPDFIVVAGDLVESGNEQRDWDEFWRHNAGELGDIAGTTPIFPVVGNHENHAGPKGGGGTYTVPLAKAALARLRTYFETPDNGTGRPEWQDRFYRVDYGPVTLIAIDSSNGVPNRTDKDTNWYLFGEGETDAEGHEGEAPDFNPGSVQYKWLEAQLADAHARSRFTFVAFHHVPYSVGPHGFPVGEAGYEKGEDNQSGVPMRVLTPLLRKYGVAALLCGHDEIYEHSVVDGLHVYCIGSAGDGLRGPYRGKGGLYKQDMENPYQVFLAHDDAPEVWDGRRLVSGGKHYGHMEVNVWLDEKVKLWRAEILPVYVFPLMDAEGKPTGWERRLYDDVVTLTAPVTGERGP